MERITKMSFSQGIYLYNEEDEASVNNTNIQGKTLQDFYLLKNDFHLREFYFVFYSHKKDTKKPHTVLHFSDYHMY